MAQKQHCVLESKHLILADSQLRSVMFIVLTMRKGKPKPTVENSRYLWLPVMTNAARRSDWTKSSLLSVIPAPADETGVTVSLWGSSFTISELCARTRSSTEDDYEDDQAGCHVRSPRLKSLHEVIQSAAVYSFAFYPNWRLLRPNSCYKIWSLT